LHGNRNQHRTRPRLDEKDLQPQELAPYRQALIESTDPDAPRIRVCCGTGCKAVGSLDVLEAMKTAVAAAGVDVHVMPEVKRTGCHGFCSRGPLLTLEPQGLFYQRIKPEDAAEIVQKTVVAGELVPRLLYKPRVPRKPSPRSATFPFLPNRPSWCSSASAGSTLRHPRRHRPRRL